MKRVEQALTFISPVTRDTWLLIGMALKSEYGDAARDVWMYWSRQADSFRESDAIAVWKSFRGTGVTIASLFHEAKLNGWRDDKAYQAPSAEQIEAQRRVAAERLTKYGQERIKAAQVAAIKADWILSQCKPERHAYLDSKGFHDLEGLVWRPQDEVNLLCVPMRVGRKLVGLQIIDKAGAKKFLSGQITSKAEFLIDSGAPNADDWWVPP